MAMEIHRFPIGNTSTQMVDFPLLMLVCRRVTAWFLSRSLYPCPKLTKKTQTDVWRKIFQNFFHIGSCLNLHFKKTGIWEGKTPFRYPERLRFFLGFLWSLIDMGFLGFWHHGFSHKQHTSTHWKSNIDSQKWPYFHGDTFQTHHFGDAARWVFGDHRPTPAFVRWTKALENPTFSRRCDKGRNGDIWWGGTFHFVKRGETWVNRGHDESGWEKVLGSQSQILSRLRGWRLWYIDMHFFVESCVVALPYKLKMPWFV